MIGTGEQGMDEQGIRHVTGISANGRKIVGVQALADEERRLSKLRAKRRLARTRRRKGQNRG